MSEQPFSLAIHGAGGRMGQRLIALSHRDPQLRLQAALEAPQSKLLGQDSGELAGIGRNGIPLSASLENRVDVVIDFSVPAAAAQIAEACAQRQIPLVVATTGLEGELKDRVLAAAQQTPVLISPSMSLAVNVAMNLVRKAAQVLRGVPDGVDVEVIERHHRFKEDAPSGTALRFGQIVAEEMRQSNHVHGRHGRPGARPRTVQPPGTPRLWGGSTRPAAGGRVSPGARRRAPVASICSSPPVKAARSRPPW